MKRMNRKLLLPALILVTLLLLSLLMVSVVLADNGPHGAYTATTDACAGCHRAHTGKADNLLKIAGESYDLCLACHGSGATGAGTNVQDGLYLGTAYGSQNMSLLGGGFDNATMNVDLSAPITTTATSFHIYDLSTGTLWGSGAPDSGVGDDTFKLTCVKCHNPHGNAGSGGSATYRILRRIPTGSGGSGVDVADETTIGYTIADETDKEYYGQVYDATRMTALNNWCGQCHDRIHSANAGDSTTGIYAYRHDTTGTNVGTEAVPNPGPADEPGCLSCHVGHGTVASMAGFAGDVEAPGDTLDSGTMGSALLRINNRGVCYACHENP